MCLDSIRAVMIISKIKNRVQYMTILAKTCIVYTSMHIEKNEI